MGGAVAQEIALAHPERLFSLILHDTADSFSAATLNPNVALWRDHRFQVAEHSGMAAVAEIAPPFPPPPHMPRDRMEETKKRLAAMSVDAFIGAWNGLAAWPGTGERARAIRTPTLVIYGDLDTQMIIDGSLRLAATIPDAEVAVIPETGHSPQWERPDLFNAALGAFLNRVSGER